MWIALAIIAFIALLITAICLLPIRIIVKSDEQTGPILRYRFLCKTYGEDPELTRNSPITKLLKKSTGVDRLEKGLLGKNPDTGGLKSTVSTSYSVVGSLLKELVPLLKGGVLSRLQVYIRCGDDDAAQAASHYGQCCLVTSTLLDVLRSFMKIRERNCNVDIGCDFSASHSVFHCDIMLTIRLGQALAALWRVTLAEAKRSQLAQEK